MFDEYVKCNLSCETIGVVSGSKPQYAIMLTILFLTRPATGQIKHSPRPHAQQPPRQAQPGQM